MNNSKKVSRENMHRHNKFLILNELRSRDLSRSDLSVLTGLSNSTIGLMIKELSERGMITEKGIAQSSGGRKPILLSLNGASGYTLLFKLTPCQLIVAVVDLKMRIVYEHCYETVLNGGESVKAALKLAIGRAISSNREALRNLMGVAVSVPGLINHQTGRIIYSSRLKLRNYDVCSVIRHEIDADIFVFKDTDAMMLGERFMGEISENDSCLYFTVSSGVGVSYLDHGSLLQLNRSGLEIGHVTVEPDGIPCNCGKRGCLEAYVGELAAARALLPKNGGLIRYRDFIDLALSGEKAAEQELKRQCVYLGRAIAVMVNLFAPNQVLIGGPLSLAGERYSSLIKKSMSENVLDIFGDVRLRLLQTGDRSSLTGMANYVFNRTFFLN